MAGETITVKLLLDGEPIGTKFMSKDQAKCARTLLQNMCHQLTDAHDLDGVAAQDRARTFCPTCGMANCVCEG